MKKRKVINLFTHNDLDGVGCSILANCYARLNDIHSVSVKYCDYHSINHEIDKLLDYLEIHKAESLEEAFERTILITDISIDYKTARRLDDYGKTNLNTCVVLIDHHQIKDEIRQFPWVMTNTDAHQCGTSLLSKFLWQRHTPSPFMSQFVYDVCLYDTWRFDQTKETNAKNLNILLGLLGAEEFENMLSNWFTTIPASFIVSNMDCYPFVESELRREKEYCALRNRTMQKIKYKGLTVGVAFAERYISSVGDYILRNNDDIDFCAIVNLPKAVSLRTRRDDINMGVDIARPLGGGGHPKAAGYQLDELPEELIKQIVGMEETKNNA